MPHSYSQSSDTEIMQQATEWFVRLRADDVSENDLYAFADWLAKDHKNSEAFAAAEKLFADMVTAVKYVETTSEMAKTPNLATVALFHKQPKRRSQTIYWSFMATAAVCLIAVLILPKDAMTDWISDYHTKTGEAREIILADGSQLLLNTNSAISTRFNSSIRQIILHHGQVRFTVESDKHRPFEVLVDELVVRSLGTVFDIYKQQSDDITVTVQEHAVVASLQKETEFDQLLKIKEGQQLIYHAGKLLSKPEAVDLNQTTAWQLQRLFINDRPLGELIEELNRYRVGRIFVSDADLKNLHITGVFSLDRPEEVLVKVCEVLKLKQIRLTPWMVWLHR